MRAVYQHGHISTCMWPYIHNLAQHCGPLRRILLSTMGHSAESLTTAQNHKKFIEKFATTFKETARRNVYIQFTYKNCTTQGLYLPCLKSFPKNWFSAEGHYAEWYSNLNISAKSKLNSKRLQVMIRGLDRFDSKKTRGQNLVRPSL